MSFKRCRAIDLETTGLPEDNGRICEIGWHDIIIDGDQPKPFPEPQSTLINPMVPMPTSAMAVHHITDDIVAPATKNVRDTVGAVLQKADVLIAHRASFEQAFINTRKPWICTYKVARRLHSALEGYSLQYLRYHFKLPVDHDKAMPPHRAGPDAYVTGHLFVMFLKEMNVQEMIDVSLKPVLLYRCDLPKHKDIPWEDLAQADPGYLQWILQSDFDEDTTYTAGYWLKRAG